jgi:hypothetical protein
MPQTSTSREESTIKVHRENASPISQRQLFDGSNPLRTGIADQNIDTAKLSNRTFHSCLYRVFLCHIRFDSENRNTGLLDDICGDRFCRRLVEIGNDDPCACSSKSLHNGVTDPRSASCHDGHFACELPGSHGFGATQEKLAASSTLPFPR